MAFLTPTISYLHSFFEGSRPASPNAQIGEDSKGRASEMDHFAAAFQVANDSRPTMEDERTADPFSMFCETPGSPSESRFFELSPPDSNGPDFSFDHDESAVDPALRSSLSGGFQNTATHNTIQPSKALVAPSQSYLLPPTPPITAYSSPYANATAVPFAIPQLPVQNQYSQQQPHYPSSHVSQPPQTLTQQLPLQPQDEHLQSTQASAPNDVPAPLAPRRRGPKPKNHAGRSAEEKEEIRAKFLERNKHAAKRCRERKKLGTEAMMKLLREQEDAVLQLRLEKEVLEEELASLRSALATCGCTAASLSSAPDSDEPTKTEGVILHMSTNEKLEELQDDEMNDWLVASPEADGANAEMAEAA